MNSNTPQKRYYRRLINSGIAPQKVARFNKYLRTVNRSKSTILPLSSLYRMFDEQASERARRAPGAIGMGASALGRGTVSAGRALGRRAVTAGRAIGSGAVNAFRREAPKPLPANFVSHLQVLSKEGLMSATKTERFAKWYQSLPNTRKQIYGTNYKKARENFNRSIGERTGRFFGAYGSKRNLPTSGMNSAVVHKFVNTKTNNRNKKLRFLNYYRRLPVNLKNATQLQKVYNNFNRSAGERTRRAPGVAGRAIGSGASTLRAKAGNLGGRISSGAANLRGQLATRATALGKFSENRFSRQNSFKPTNFDVFYTTNRNIPQQNFQNYVMKLKKYQIKNKQLENLYKNYEPIYSRQKRLRNVRGYIGNRATTLRGKIASGATYAGKAIGNRATTLRGKIASGANYASKTIRGFNKGPPLTLEQLGELSNYHLNINTKLSFRRYVNGLTVRQRGNKNTKTLFNNFFAKTGRSGISNEQREIIRSNMRGNNSDKEAFIKHLESLHPKNRNNRVKIYNKFSAKNMTKNYIETVKRAIEFQNTKGNYTLLNSFIKKLKNIPPNNRNTENKIKSLYTEFNVARKALGEFNLAKEAVGNNKLNNRFKNILRRTEPKNKNTKEKISNLYKTVMKPSMTSNTAINMTLNSRSEKMSNNLKKMFKNYAKSTNNPLKASINNFYKNKKMREKILNSYGMGTEFTKYWLTNSPNQNISNPNLLKRAFNAHKAATTRFQSIAQLVKNNQKTRGQRLYNVAEQARLLNGTENLSNSGSNVSINVPPTGRFASAARRLQNVMRLRR